VAAKDFQNLLDEFGEFNKKFTEEYGEGLVGDDARRFGVFVVGAEVQKTLENSIAGLAAAGVEVSKQGQFLQSEILDLAKRSLDANTEEAREIRKDLEGILSLTKDLADSERKALEKMVTQAAVSVGEVGDFGNILLEGLMDSLPDWMTDSAKTAEKFLPGFLGKLAGNTIRAGRRRKTEEATRAERFRRIGLGAAPTADEEIVDVDSEPIDTPLTPASFGDDKIYACLVEIKDRVGFIADTLAPKGTGTDKLEAKEAELEAGRSNAEATGEAVVDNLTSAGGAAGMGIVGTMASEITGEVVGNVIGNMGSKIFGGKTPLAMGAGVAQGQNLVFDKRIGSKGGYRDMQTGRFAKAPAPAAAPKASKMGSIQGYAGAFATAAQGLILLAGALLIFNMVEWTSIAKAAVALPLFLAIMAGAVKIMPPDKDLMNFAKSAAILAGALAILGGALLIFKFVDIEAGVAAAIAMVSLLGFMRLAVKVMPPQSDLIKFSVSAVIMGVGVAALGLGLLAFKTTDYESMLKAGIAILGIVGVAYAVGKLASKAMKDIAIFAATMPVLAIGVAALGLAMSMFEGVTLGTVAVLATTLIVLGAAIAAFAIAIASGVGGAVLGLAIAMLGALGVALIPFGIAAVLAGYGMKLLGEGAMMLGKGLAVVVDAGGDFLITLTDQIIKLAGVGFMLPVVAAGIVALGLAIGAFMLTAGAGSLVGGIMGGIGSFFGGDSASPLAVMAMIGDFAQKAQNLPQIVKAVDQLRYALVQFSTAELDMANLDQVFGAFDRFSAETGLAGFFGMGKFTEFSTLLDAGEGLLKTADALNALGPAMRNFAESSMGEDFFKEGWFTESGWENLMEVLQEGIEEIDIEKLDALGTALFKLGMGMQSLADVNLISARANITTATTIDADDISPPTVPSGPIQTLPRPTRTPPRDLVGDTGMTEAELEQHVADDIEFMGSSPFQADLDAHRDKNRRQSFYERAQQAAPPQPTTSVGPSQTKANAVNEGRVAKEEKREEATAQQALQAERDKIFNFGQNIPIGTTTFYTAGRTQYQVTRNGEMAFEVSTVGRKNRNRTLARESGRGSALRAKLFLARLIGKEGTGETISGMVNSTKIEQLEGELGYRPVSVVSWSPESSMQAEELRASMSFGGAAGGAGITGVPLSSTMGSPTAMTAEGETVVNGIATNATLKSEQETASANVGKSMTAINAPVNTATINNNQTVAMSDLSVRNSENSFRESQQAQYGISSKG
tara:strand:+ start:42193 stop:45921 length:3729 start_codon:yes stop_codon:yes gene_type:complete